MYNTVIYWRFLNVQKRFLNLSSQKIIFGKKPKNTNIRLKFFANSDRGNFEKYFSNMLRLSQSKLRI